MSVVLGLSLCLAAQEGKVDAIERLIQAAEVGTDDGFRTLMQSDKQLEGHTAPAALRKLLASLKILRMDMGQAYTHEDGKAALVWWFGEIGIAGEPDEVKKRLQDALVSYGFQAGEKDTYTQSSGGATHQVVLEGPRPWTGGKETACGIELYWKVEEASQSPAPTLLQILERLPILRDGRVDAAVVEALGKKTAVGLAFGGTWTRYYDWDVVLAADSPEGGVRLREELEKLLTGLEYEKSEKGADHETFHRKKTGSYAWLHAPDEKQRVRIRFQPES